MSLIILCRCWRRHGLKISKSIENIAIFDDFWAFFSNSAGGRSGCGPKISTYILFGSISTQNVRFWNNLAWSRGLRGPRSKSTAPGQGVCAWCVLECACRPAGAVRAEQISRKSEKRTKTRAASVQMCCISIFFGNFNRPRNHGETEVKITVKSKIWTFGIGWNIHQVRGASGYKCLKCGKKCVWDDFGRSSSPYFTFRNIFSLHVFKISDIHFHWPVWVQLPKRVRWDRGQNHHEIENLNRWNWLKHTSSEGG